MKQDFENNIKDLMNSHRVEAPSRVWKNIQNKKSKIWYSTLWFKSTVAICILCLSLFPFNNPTSLAKIYIESKPIHAISTSHFQNLNKSTPSIPFNKEVKNSVIRFSEKEIPVINQKNEEVIVLKINPKKYRKKKKRIVSKKKTPIIIDSKVLLAEIENQIIKEDQNNLEKYLTKITKFSKSEKLNKSVITASNWVKKSLNKKNKK